MSGIDDAAIAEALAEWPSPVRSSASWDAAAQRLLAQIVDPVSKSSLTAPAWQETIALAARRDPSTDPEPDAVVEASSENVRPESTFASSDDFDADWDAVAPPPNDAALLVPLHDDALFLPPLPRAADEPEELDEPPVPSTDVPERRSGSVSPPMAGRSDTDVTAEMHGDGPISMRRPSTHPSRPSAPEAVVAAIADSARAADSGHMSAADATRVSAADAARVPERAELVAPENNVFGEEAVTAETSMPVSYESPLSSAAASFVPPPLSGPTAEEGPATQRRRNRRAVLWGGLAAMAVAASAIAWMKAKAPASDLSPVAAISATAPEPTSSALASTAATTATAATADPSETAMPVPLFDRLSGSADGMNNVVPEEKPAARPSKRFFRKSYTATKPKKDDVLKPPDGTNPMRIAAAPNDSSSSVVPQRPANGAVQGALSLVLPKARACLRREDGISRATLLFDSSGKVVSTSVTGASAGKPAEGCIRNALRQMKLPAFAEPKFSAIVTVRPP